MKRVLFKGKPFYIPEGIAIDDAIPVMNKAYAHSNIAEQIWKDNGTEVAQITKAGEYNIKWLNDESKIYILPDQFFEKTYQKHEIEEERISQFPILGIGYGDQPYFPGRTDTNFIYSQWNTLPSENDNIPWLTDEGDFKFIIMQTGPNSYLEKKFERLHWTGDQDAIYDYSDLVSDVSDYSDPVVGFDGYFWFNDCLYSIEFYWELIFCYAASQECIPGIDCDCDYTHFIAEGTTWLERRDRTYDSFIVDDITGTILQTSVDHRIQQVIYTGLAQSYNDDRCVRSYTNFSTGLDLWVDAGHTYQDPSGEYHFAYIWTDFSWDDDIEIRNLTVDNDTIEIFRAPRWPLPGGYTTYAINCAIYPFAGTIAVCYCWTFMTNEYTSFTRYGLYFQGTHQYLDVNLPNDYDVYADIWGLGERNLVAYVIGVTLTEKEDQSGNEAFDTLNVMSED